MVGIQQCELRGWQVGSGSKSREHHWWPVGLQKFWADENGYVAWITADGKKERKQFKNRKIARKAHGHTALRGGVWITNFEDDFQEADDAVRCIICQLKKLTPFGRSLKEFFQLIKMLFKRDRSLKAVCNFYTLEENLHRRLLLLLMSLLIRSPATRFRYESFPEQFGLPANEDVGKLNMRQMFSTAKRLCETGSLSNQYFVLIHSPFKTFIFGDGHLDWLTYKLFGLSINGRALVPLTPRICIYFCTRGIARSGPNCASLTAVPWMVDCINDITQIYSGDKLFYQGRPPKLSQSFRQCQFLEHKEKADEFIDMLDEIASNKNSERAQDYSALSFLR